MHRFNLVFIIAFATLTITTFGVNKSSFVVLAINGPIQQNQQDNDSGNSNSSSSYTLRSRMGDENSNRLNAREESLDENLCNKLYLTDNIPSGKKYPVTCSVYYQCSRNSKGISSAPYDTLWYKCASGYQFEKEKEQCQLASKVQCNAIDNEIDNYDDNNNPVKKISFTTSISPFRLLRL